jgi:hypothetical protein
VVIERLTSSAAEASWILAADASELEKLPLVFLALNPTLNAGQVQQLEILSRFSTGVLKPALIEIQACGSSNRSYNRRIR